LYLSQTSANVAVTSSVACISGIARLYATGPHFSKCFCVRRSTPGGMDLRENGKPSEMTLNLDGTAVVSGGILGHERIIAKPGFNCWLVPPAALATHLCIGMAYYGGSAFSGCPSRSVGAAAGTKVPACAAGATTFWTVGTLTALTATNCRWTQFDLGWMFTLFFVLLGSLAAIWGGWLERAGPRKSGVYAALCGAAV
jgi:hypothetical protein